MEHNLGVATMPILSSQAAPEATITTTSCLASDDKVGIMTTLDFFVWTTGCNALRTAHSHWKHGKPASLGALGKTAIKMNIGRQEIILLASNHQSIFNDLINQRCRMPTLVTKLFSVQRITLLDYDQPPHFSFRIEHERMILKQITPSDNWLRPTG